MIASPQPPAATLGEGRAPERHADPARASASRSARPSTLNPQPSTSLIEPLEARIAPAHIVAHSIGGSGNWSDPAHWDIGGGAIPNNGGGNTYSVVIDLPASAPVITIDQSISLAGLTNSDVLHIATGVSTLSTSLVNTGAIDVGSSIPAPTPSFAARPFRVETSQHEQP